MNSIYEEIVDVYNSSDWKYYYSLESDSNPFISAQEAFKFIKSYYEKGAKGNVILGFDIEIEGIKFKEHLQHTIIVFFLGELLVDRLFDRQSLSIKSEEQSLNGGNYTFNYIWFICCLYHDYGYYFEDMKTDTCLTSNIKLKPNMYKCLRQKIYKYLKMSDITYGCSDFSNKKRNLCHRKYFCNAIKDEKSLIKNCTKQCSGEIIYEQNDLEKSIVVNKERYTQKIKTNYLLYRLGEFEIVDHGIVGADLLFDRLFKNYVDHIEKREYKEYWRNISSFMSERLLFACEQFKVWSYIGDCIAAHNIWKCPKDANDEKVEKYKKYGLDNLIGDNFKKIYFKDNPLLFILCLCDSIEPTKRSNNIDILKEIMIDIKKEENIFTLAYRGNDSKIVEYIKSLEKCEDWLGVEIRYLYSKDSTTVRVQIL